MNTHSLMRRQRGISLVELMIAILLGMILTAGILQIVLANKSTYRVNEGLSRMQENVRFAQQLLARDIRMVGYTGCASGADFPVLNVLNPPADSQYNMGVGLTGHQYSGSSWSDAVPTAISGTIDTASDALSMEMLVGAGTRLAEEMPNTSADLKVVSPSAVSDFDILFVSDCTRGAVFQVTNVTTGSSSGRDNLVHNTGVGSPGNAQKELTDDNQPFGTDASIWQLTSLTYYIAPSAVTNNRGETVNALWRLEVGQARELVRGVESMRLWYGVDVNDDGVPNRYVRAADVSDWGAVIAVRVQLTVNSVDDVASDGDGRIRQTFTQTIKIRNRGMDA